MKGKNVLVCGSTQGIGWAAAQQFAANGANVILLARNAGKLAENIAALENDGTQNHQFITADFTQPLELQKVIDTWISNGNTVDVLVNNTGGPKGGPIVNAQVQEFLDAFNQHLICNHILATAFIPGMKVKGWGRIINVISTSVKQPLPNLGVSNTIRGAVASWSKTLANELGPFNITVNNVLPGATNTGRLQSIIENKANTINESVDAIREEMADESPMKRIAEPQEVANAIYFLASDNASYINGINVPVDGGRTKSL